MITVIIPAYNEQATIGELVRRVIQAPYEKQIIVVDDCSADATFEIASKFDCQVVRHSVNRGKGAAIRTGLAQARGEFTIIQDADLEYDPNDYPKLMEPLLNGADVVYGSRYLIPRGRRGRLTMRLGVEALNVLVRVLYGVTLTDEATCYKAFRTELLRSMDLQCERFEFCPEVTAKALRMGLRIIEVPIRYDARSIQDGKKIRIRDGVEAVSTLWRFRRWSPASQSDFGQESLKPRAMRGASSTLPLVFVDDQDSLR